MNHGPALSGIARSQRPQRGRWFWRLVRRFCAWYHGEEPRWYMHRQWTLDGQILNALAKADERAESKLLRLPILDMSDIIAELKKDPPKRSSPNK